MSVTTPSQGQKISDFSEGIVDANSYFIQARNGGTSKVPAPKIGQFSNLNLLFTGEGGLDTTAKTIVGAINEVNSKTAEDIPVSSSSSSETIAEAIDALSFSDSATLTYNSIPFGFRRNGNFVFVSASYGSTVQFPSGWTNIGTLPENFRPSSNIVFCGMIFPNGNFLQMRISPSTGSVEIYPSSTNAMYPQGSTVYAI